MRSSTTIDVTVVIIGGGQAGLAMSRCLTERSIPHVVLERGDVANSWRTERWDSLRLLTPNWMTRLPGGSYAGPDPDGYMTATEVAMFLDDYRRSIEAPVIGNTVVESVEPLDGGFCVVAAEAEWRCRGVVVATGACSTPRIPAIASDLPASIQQITPIGYRNPDEVDSGRVLVVGASASGAQIADELALAGRDVTIAVGDHVRLPRTYRGMNIHWWMSAIGVLGERFDEVDDITRARRIPSLQLVGSPEQRTLDLNTLADHGVTLTGRLVGIADGSAQYSGSLANMLTSADLKMGRLLDEVDRFASENGLDREVAAPDRPAPTRRPAPRLVESLSSYRAVVWATGFRPNHPWLPDQVLDASGGIVHDGGVMAHPGMYVLGLPFLRRRKSSFLDGVGPDAEELADHLRTHLAGRTINQSGSAALAS